MNKWHGMIGFADSIETKPGVYKDKIVERPFYGVMSKQSLKAGFADSSTVTELQVHNQLSVIADSYAISNFSKIVYVTCMGTKVKVTNIEIDHPRLNLILGGTYNG